MPTVKKLPKWAIKQAGGINKKAWALARRGKGRKMSRAKPSKRARRRRTPRSVGSSSHNSNNNKKGWGRTFRVGRTIDVFTGPAQGSLGNHGLSPEAGKDALRRYSAGLSEGAFDADSAKATAGGIGTGLLRDWFRSKLGIYRGLGRKKFLSGVMAANPEILATSEISPGENLIAWNHRRVQYDRGYDTAFHLWNVQPGTEQGTRFLKSLGLDAVLKVTQKVAEIYINPMLPRGYNL